MEDHRAAGCFGCWRCVAIDHYLSSYSSVSLIRPNIPCASSYIYGESDVYHISMQYSD